ncbi:MAG: hypothetical protein LH475_07675 [Cryobacterium sp.]|uniref:hypothetical protein n=1 Tax=unclassified Cryobacterium TaxID=2649013 RepID=UPI0018CBA31B|nr:MULTISPECIES: hypothetical protein [unclassified Cryobacterium]MCY7404490.1 hypothetical protein [Cryobacterium sp.]MEC5153996.1 hypothetical protein [Cryobacterium sp. CAN_C3]
MDALELQLEEAARLVVSTSSTNEDVMVSTSSTNRAGSTNAWTPPAGLAALPPELGARVRHLLGNQKKLVGELAAARAGVGRHLAAVRSVPPRRDARASVYLDVDG